MKTDVLEEIIPCVGCGFCCSKAPCGFGEVSGDGHSCKFQKIAFSDDVITIYMCVKHDEIQKEDSSKVSPAFGAGCCMQLFNSARRRILNYIRKRGLDLPFSGSGFRTKRGTE